MIFFRKTTISWIIFLTLIFCGLSEPRADTAWDAANLEIKLLIAQATKKRAGVLVWVDLQENQLQVEGDSQLIDKKIRPASAFKLITAESALREGLDFHYRCIGHDRIAGSRQYCWNTRGHGQLDLSKALAFSCNLFFSQLGLKLSQSALMTTLGYYPEFDLSPLTQNKLSESNLAQLSIGDSSLLKISPRQMLNFWVRYLKKIQDPKMTPIVQGLRRSVQEGTASRHVGHAFNVLAKTGTADAENSSYKTDAWFLGAYPAERPRFAFVIFLQRAHGYEEAAVLGDKIFRVFLKYFPE